MRGWTLPNPGPGKMAGAKDLRSSLQALIVTHPPDSSIRNLDGGTIPTPLRQDTHPLTHGHGQD